VPAQPRQELPFGSAGRELLHQVQDRGRLFHSGASAGLRLATSQQVANPQSAKRYQLIE